MCYDAYIDGLYRMQKYHQGTIIRNKITGKPLLVLHVYRIAVIVVDPTEGSLPTPHVLMERDFDTWAEEKDFYSKEDENDKMEPDVQFDYKPITL